MQVTIASLRPGGFGRSPFVKPPAYVSFAATKRSRSDIGLPLVSL